MQVRKFVVLAAVLIGFAGAPVTRAFADDTSTSTTTKHKKKKKKGKKANRTKKHAHAKKSASHHARSHKNTAGSGAAAGTHYPTQPGGSGFADIPAEKKDDLPPPAAPANQ